MHTLERSLLNRAVELDLSDVEDLTTRTAMFNTLTLGGFAEDRNRRRPRDRPESGHSAIADGPPRRSARRSIPMSRRLPRSDRATRSAFSSVLRGHDGVPASLVPHIIPLLAWDAVAQEAMIALRKVAEERVGELTDALVNPNQPFAVRRRLARVFSVCTSQRAADGLMLGLDDLRFEVRFHCARSLAEMLEKNPRIRIDRERIFEVVQREAAVGRPVWESQRLLDQVDDLAPERSSTMS